MTGEHRIGGWTGRGWTAGRQLEDGASNGFGLSCVRAPLRSPPQRNLGFPRPKEIPVFCVMLLLRY